MVSRCAADGFASSIGYRVEAKGKGAKGKPHPSFECEVDRHGSTDAWTSRWAERRCRVLGRFLSAQFRLRGWRSIEWVGRYCLTNVL